jgi:hypothetical protein
MNKCRECYRFRSKEREVEALRYELNLLITENEHLRAQSKFLGDLHATGYSVIQMAIQQAGLQNAAAGYNAANQMAGSLAQGFTGQNMANAQNQAPNVMGQAIDPFRNDFWKR